MNNILSRCPEPFADPDAVHTYFLGREEVLQYAKDLAYRLDALDENFPRVWCAIGYSGAELASLLGEALPQTRKNMVQVVLLEFNRDTYNVTFRDPADEAVFDKTGPVLVIDSAVHSGVTMQAAVRRLEKAGATMVCSYSLVVKKGTCFVPNFFGLLIHDQDRAFFLLDRIPNNRLVPFGSVRRLEQSDISRDPDHVNSGLPSIDKITWADLWYEVRAKGSNVFVYESNGTILGFISFYLKDKDQAFVDGIAIDNSAQGKGVGKSLIRWSETWARAANCKSIDLWGVHERLSFYRHMGFDLTKEELALGLERYTRMRRKLLYNLESHTEA